MYRTKFMLLLLLTTKHDHVHARNTTAYRNQQQKPYEQSDELTNTRRFGLPVYRGKNGNLKSIPKGVLVLCV